MPIQSYILLAQALQAIPVVSDRQRSNETSQRIHFGCSIIIAIYLEFEMHDYISVAQNKIPNTADTRWETSWSDAVI
jgi:hypothetical protein